MGKAALQIISKGKTIYCVTSVPYPPEIVRQMKKAGYNVKVIEK